VASYRVRRTDLGRDEACQDEVRSGEDLIATGFAWPCGEPLTASIWELEALDG
jgi:hypothetical protein